MDPENKQSTENKGRSGLTLLLISITLGLGLVLVMVLTQKKYELTSGQLERLLDATEYQEYEDTQLVGEKTGLIKIKNPRFQDRWDQLSHIRDIEIGRRKISGKLKLRTADASLATPSASDWSEEKTVDFRVNRLESDRQTSALISKLKQKNISYKESSGPGFFERYAFLLFMVAVLVLLFFWMVRRLGGASGPMQFGRSRGKLCSEDDLKITFADAAGIDEAVAEVREVVDFLQNSEKYQKLGGRIPRGVLLVGPPGTGKTLLAKAIAGEAKVPFFSLSGSDFVEMFVGVGAARVRDMFQQAVARAPCIIFIDELDALGKSRSGSAVGGHDEREQTLNALLVEMDGFASNSGVIVLAATNRPETLDQALMRPGRFDRHVLVDRPDIAGREAILKVHVKSVKLDPEVDLRYVATISSGFAGAELANLVNEAALLAARKEKSSVGMDEFNEGVERVTAGLEKKQRVMNAEEKQRVAYHESGHALVAYSLPNTDPVHKVTIIPRGLAALGYTMQRPEGERFLMTQSELESQIQILLAGTLTEEMIFRDISTGAQNDLERCASIARAMVTRYGMSRMGRVNYAPSEGSPFLAGATGAGGGNEYSEKTAGEIDSEVKRIVDESIEKVRHILEVRKNALVALADRLVEVETVNASELKQIIEDTSPGPIVVPGTAAGNRTREFRSSDENLDQEKRLDDRGL